MDRPFEADASRRRVVWMGVLVAVLLVVAFAWSWRALRGPQYAGRTVFEWLEEGFRKRHREAMRAALIEMGPRAVPSLVLLFSVRETNALYEVTGLLDQVPGIDFERVHPRQLRSWSVEALGMLGAQASNAVPALTNALAASDPHLFTQILETLGAMGPAATKAVPLLEAMAESRPGDRVACFRTLSNIDPENTAARLEQAIAAEREPMQRAALIGMHRWLRWRLKHAAEPANEGVAFLPMKRRSLPLLEDPRFRRGVRVLDPRPGERSVLEDLEAFEVGEGPAWFLAQWNSKRSLTRADRYQEVDGSVVYVNGFKRVEFFSGDPRFRSGDVELGVDGLNEWDQQWRTNANTPWPHLLVEQDINSPSLEAMLALSVLLEVQLMDSRRSELPGRSVDLHCAQLQLVMTVQDRNPQSRGFGDFLWLVLPLFDDRYSVPPPHMAPDTADPSAKFIYNPGGQWHSDQNYGMRFGIIRYKRWTQVGGDVYPLVLDAVRTAWQRGYLEHSKDEKDLRVTSVNLGWEVTGLNQVRARFRNLSLDAWVENE